MSSSVNYDDLYEEFVRLTSSPRPDPRVTSVSPTTTQAFLEVEYRSVTYEINESLDRSPLKVLTPPSPISSIPPPPPTIQQSASFTFQRHTQISSTSSEEYIIPEIMCDSSQVTSPNIAISSAVSTSVAPAPGGKQIMPVETSSVHNNNLGNGQSFMPGILPNAMLQQTQQNQQNHSMPPVQGNNLGNVGMNPQHHQQQSPHNIHHQMHHSMQTNGCPGIQHHPMMENPNHLHHHLMHSQMNLPHHQHGAHQLQHGPPHQSHHPLPHHAHNNQQQYIPFGMQLNANNIGNGSAYPNHQMHPFHHHPGSAHHQIPNQQPAHAMSMTPLQQTCFMQHCMHYQQNSQQPSSLVAALNSPRVPNAVSWMNNPPSSGPIANQSVISTTNQGNNAAPVVSMSPTQTGGKKVSTPSSTPKLQNATLPDPSALPGGLEVLWRELPLDYQKLLYPQDIPDTAKFRGYFTVCELLVLKRLLETRYIGSLKSLSSPVQRGTLNKLSTSGISKGEGHGRRGSKRGGKDKGRASNKGSGAADNTGKENGNRSSSEGSAKNPRNQNITENYDTEGMQEDTEENSLNGELMITLENMKQEIHTTTTPAVTGVGVGGVVKEAMDALSSSGSTTTDQIGGNMDNQATTGSSNNDEMAMITGKDSDSDELVINENLNAASVITTNEAISHEEMDQRKETTTNEVTNLPMLPSMPEFAGIFSGKKCPVVGENMMVTSTCSNSQAVERNKEDESENANEGQQQLQLALASSTGETSPSTTISDSGTHVNNNTSAQGGGCCSQFSPEGRYSGQMPPPYRTSTLVIKLLQIGNYHIRSFSNINPNRLRVLFNTQRMTYECQLPIIQTATPDSTHSQLTRKVLTIDIGFEQINMLKFGTNSLWMRVDGAPLLTISTNPAQEEAMNDVLSPHDQYLLEQIEKGQLKLSPIHQLYFLNERLVQLLASQFRVHPRFRNIVDTSQ